MMATESLVRSDFTDNHSYTYANFSRRLTQETVGLSATSNWTTAFTYDSGAPGGPGVLTSMGQAVGTNVNWSGGVDGFSRIGVGTNSVAQRQAYGFLNGVATMTALLDGNQMPVTTVGTNDNYEWRAQLQLQPGAHRLIVNALNWSGYYTASATNTFTNNAADHALDTYAGNGEITKRVWLTSAGLTNATESLSFDARDRLHNVTYLDSNTNGYSWNAIYDGLGRRLSTTTTFITNGVVQTNFTRTISQYFDPHVQFLEVAETDSGVTTVKFYGPDANGVYGGMQGVGGLEAVDNGPRAASPAINDMRGNALALYSLTQGSVTWFSSRVTAYGAVPGYAPLPLGDGAKIVAASAWRGKWADITGFVWIGNRYYYPTEGRWLSFDQSWNETDPNGFTFCGGQPVTAFDPDGMIATQVGNEAQTDLNALPQFALNVGNNVESGNNNFWTGVFNSGGSLLNAIGHPIDTTVNVVNGVGNAIQNPVGTAENIYNGVATSLSNPDTASQFIGSLTFGAETTIAGGAALNALGGALGDSTPLILQNAASGQAFESSVINALGAAKNTASITVDGLGTSIPDIVDASGNITEIKNGINLSYSPQLQIQAQTAQSAGGTFNLIVSPNTQYISGPLRQAVFQSGGSIQVFNPATGAFTAWVPK
jgi:RHS repeat-associated protein